MNAGFVGNGAADLETYRAGVSQDLKSDPPSGDASQSWALSIIDSLAAALDSATDISEEGDDKGREMGLSRDPRRDGIVREPRDRIMSRIIAWR